MSEDDLLHRVLLLAMEDDSGLWEVRWELNTHEPSLPVPERDRRADRAVRQALARGWIELRRVVEPFGDAEVIRPDETDAVLGDPASWEPVSFGERAIRFGATAEGQAAFTGSR